MFYVMLRALFFCSRALNAYFLLIIPHKERLSYLIFFWYTAYPLLIVSYFFRDNEEAVGIATMSCVIQVLATVLAESTILGFIKHMPQDITGMYGVGKALGQLFESVVYAVILFTSMAYFKFFFFLFLVQAAMLLNFDWFDK